MAESKKKTAKTIEETFSELDDILKAMENSETSLEKSFELYKKGKQLIDYCNNSIADIEAQVTVLEEE